jgi:hypothetical protein
MILDIMMSAVWGKVTPNDLILSLCNFGPNAGSMFDDRHCGAHLNSSRCGCDIALPPVHDDLDHSNVPPSLSNLEQPYTAHSGVLVSSHSRSELETYMSVANMLKNSSFATVSRRVYREQSLEPSQFFQISLLLQACRVL